MTRIINALSEIQSSYKVMFVDLWGCVHDGVRAFPAAVAALQAYRGSGGTVILVTNSPRSREGVRHQLAELGVPEDAWDAIATSGDSARAAMFQGVVGSKVWFMGNWDHDKSFFDPMKVIDSPVPIERVPLEEAEGIVCCGPLDSLPDPEAHRPQLLYAKQKGLKLLCANPDIVVDRGNKREWCAGAIARLYTEMGGESFYFGKPHPPIYDLARRRLAALGCDTDKAAILAIGDGPHTDILGAMGEDLDSLFITGGLAADETATGHAPAPDALERFLQNEGISPTYAIGFLQ
ncbi:TIGR01459 family HAD-type hydrolase [Pontibaca methylaminivorans]|uniref:HAD-superfamily class IIA hydrolase, TIGR01459 n=1 Tax=Pontibaca methylaminivorans TaxID=515897 RepID=A0A1R3X0H2_9RHOB|nr:TIGR01459 family HAD-type hydrolase [Pontibaca methylaminivorans]SIT84031.1 HAD-superfamily class IIA hydrolase, TIGR01459 [Pontibaca methylaminivorans]